MKSFLSQIHPSWIEVLGSQANTIEEIENQLRFTEIAPPHDLVMRALAIPFEKVKVLIVGQDPYPTPGFANGLAFSVDRSVKKLPMSLRNIKKEIENDLGIELEPHGDLTSWVSQGVCLLNRTLTTTIGESNSHINLGWREVTNSIAIALAQRDVVALLLGANAQELRGYFRLDFLVEAVHPSPLSARRGFFGSKIFSEINRKLGEAGIEPIDWQI